MEYKGKGIVLDERFLFEIMPSLNGEDIKLYILARCLAKESGRTDIQTLCDAMGKDEKYISYLLDRLEKRDALRFDKKDGIVDFEVNNKALFQGERAGYRAGEVRERIEQSKELADMLVVSQKILGKMLSYPATEKLYSFYDWLRMPPEVILRLLEYCAEMGKKDMRYIEKVALSWHEMGIDNLGEAEKYIKKQNDRQKYERRVAKIFGIDGRKLTASEGKYISAWCEKKITYDMVEFAYDYSVTINNGKYIIAYINTVLEKWSKEGIKTPKQAQESIERFREKYAKTSKQKKKPEVYNSGRYNYDELDALARQKLKERLGKK